MWQSFGPWLASGGGVGIAGSVCWLAYKLHRDAVAAIDQARRDWREMALAERDRANLYMHQRDVLAGQAVGRVSGRV